MGRDKDANGHRSRAGNANPADNNPLVHHSFSLEGSREHLASFVKVIRTLFQLRRMNDMAVLASVSCSSCVSRNHGDPRDQGAVPLSLSGVLGANFLLLQKETGQLSNLREAVIQIKSVNGSSVRIEVNERSKMLRTCSNARFGEVAQQHRELA